MAKDYLSLGSTPCDEPCAQLGKDNYHAQMRREASAYIGQLNRIFEGKLPDGMYFTNKGFPHDFGTYHEVCVIFDNDNAEHCEMLSVIEDGLPANWDNEALRSFLPAQLAEDLENGPTSTYLKTVLTFGAVLKNKK